MPSRFVRRRTMPNAACASGESPAAMVMRLAYQKAADVARGLGRGLILGCDTVAECDGQILGKPDDVDAARQMLRSSAGGSIAC